MDTRDEIKESGDSVATESAVTKPARIPGTRGGLIIGLLILLIPLIVYIVSLCPTVFVGDAGDFLTASYTLGVPHPPGYPTYTVLGKVFMELPIPGSPAYRMNMMSAVAAWLACLFLFLFLRRVLKNEWAAIAGALVLAFSRQFWEHAVIAEVYTMQIMFLNLILYLSVLYVQEKKVGWALFLAFIMGLAMTHQYAILIFYPGVLIFIGVNGGLRLKWHTWVLAVVLAIVGLLPYLYLPLVHYKTPIGEVVFVETAEEARNVPINKVAELTPPLEYFWDYFARLHYSKSREFTHNEEALPERTTTPMVFRKFLLTTEEDFGIPLIIFGILGWLAVMISIWSKRDPEPDGIQFPVAPFIMPVLGYMIYFLVTHFYPSGDILAAPLENIDVVIPPLLIPLQAALAAIIALGFDFTVTLITRYIRAQGIKDVASSQKFRTFTALLVIAVFTLILVNAWRNAEYGDKSQSTVSYHYALNVLDSCDPDSILLTTGDETFLFWYVQACEPSWDPDDPEPGYRKDVWATNWIHNLPTLELLADETNAMAIVTERFIASSTYYTPYLNWLNETYDVGIEPILPYLGDGPVNSTFVPASFAESGLIMGCDVILSGLTYKFRRPGDIPDLSRPDIRITSNLEEIESGREALEVIDIFEAAPFDTYRMGGLPRFEGLMDDLSNLDSAVYHRVNLEAQEMEVLHRYQDSFYRFGIQALLDDDPESVDDAKYYLFRCVSLDPTDWFGWNELGDAFIRAGNLDSAELAFIQLIELSTQLGNVSPLYESHAHAQIAQIHLIKSTGLEGQEQMTAIALAEQEANIALLLNPENQLALGVLNHIELVMSGAGEESMQSSVVQDEGDVISTVEPDLIPGL